MSNIPGQIAELSPARLELLFRRLRTDAGDTVGTTIPRYPADAPPLSFAQQRLWFLDQVAPGQSVYNETIMFRLTGPLDVTAFAAALSGIIARHAVLRTVFVSSAGQPSQNVLSSIDVPLSLIDLVDEPCDKEEAAINRAREAAQRPFQLDQPPLLRTVLYRLGEHVHVFLLVVHHIVWDGWSTGVFLEELAEFYEASVAGRPSRLPKLALQYCDFAAWQREQLSGAGLTALTEHWRENLRGAPPVLELSSMRPMPTQPTGRGERLPVALPRALSGEVTDLARRAEVTPFMVLLAAFATLLHQESGIADIVVGVGVAGRTSAELEPLIGLFVNILPIRIVLSDTPETASLLKRVRNACTDALSHQDLPFDLLVSALKPQRVHGVPPLVQVVFDLQNVPQPTERFKDLELQPLLIDTVSARFDLTLLLWPEGDTFAGAMEYASDRFERKSALSLTARYVEVLQNIVREPGPAPARALDRATLREANRRKLQARRAKPADAPTAPSLPLLVEPVGGANDLAAWAVDNRSFIEAKLALHGAILFCGFAVNSDRQFETFAQAVSRGLLAENGEHVPVAGMGFVQTPVFYAPSKKLLWHNENSFNQLFPTKIAFCCMQPAETGGETPLADSRIVMERIPRAVRDEFVAKGVMYIRNYGVGPGLDWRVVFRTDDRGEVERLCRENRMDFEWIPGDRLRTRCVRPAVIRHPQTGSLSWFNQAQHWHVSCLDEATRNAIAETFAPADMPRTCAFGDGSPISDDKMAVILAAYESIEVSFAWRRGDVMLLDNILVAHARNPYRGERRLLVALGDLLNYADLKS